MNSHNFIACDTPAQAIAPVELPNSPIPKRDGQQLRHILLGSPAAIRQTIHLLHQLRYVETVQWSPLIDIPQNRLIITARPNEVMSLLERHLP